MESLNYILVLIMCGLPGLAAIMRLTFLRFYRKRTINYFTRALIILLVQVLVSKFLWEFFMVYY